LREIGVPSPRQDETRTGTGRACLSAFGGSAPLLTCRLARNIFAIRSAAAMAGFVGIRANALSPGMLAVAAWLRG
jgi:hypothetical protein